MQDPAAASKRPWFEHLAMNDIKDIVLEWADTLGSESHRQMPNNTNYTTEIDTTLAMSFGQGLLEHTTGKSISKKKCTDVAAKKTGNIA